MQLYNISGWKALHFPDRTILRSDVKYMSLWEYGQLEGLDLCAILRGLLHFTVDALLHRRKLVLGYLERGVHARQPRRLLRLALRDVPRLSLSLADPAVHVLQLQQRFYHIHRFRSFRLGVENQSGILANLALVVNGILRFSASR